MINRWDTGRATIEQMLFRNQLTRVPANRELADAYIAQAKAHLESAKLIREVDTLGAFQLSYDAARKSTAAILVNQGLRARGEGSHATLIEAVQAQLVPPAQAIFDPLHWMRPLRNKSEYPSAGDQLARDEDVDESIPCAHEIIEAASKLIDAMPPFGT